MDIADLLSSAQMGEPTADQRAHMLAVAEATHRWQAEAFGNVRRFAAILCTCPPYYIWGSASPPQQGCVVHGQLAMDPATGELWP